MKVMIVGGGGREHAIALALSKSPKISKMYALPGNGGIAEVAECVDIAATDIDALTAFAKERAVEFAVVASDDPLCLGLVDRLHEAGVPCFGCSKAAAEIEGSKSFSKKLMEENNIPTARYKTFLDPDEARKYLKTHPLPLVVKADGLALGKGAVVASTLAEAEDAVRSMMIEGQFGKSGSKVVIEEFLKGTEVTVLAFTDGETLVTMPSATDHKRIGEGDEGANTGGMGVIAPSPYYTEELHSECLEKIFLPTIRALNGAGRRFKGCIYFELMITAEGAKVIEYNCRFGDPEAQTLLPLLETDLFEIMLATEGGYLADIEVRFRGLASVCVVAASGGYPVSYKKGLPITLPRPRADVTVYHAGTELREGGLFTKGGRVLAVTALGETYEDAAERAYAALADVAFEGMVFRRDIGKRAMELARKNGSALSRKQ